MAAKNTPPDLSGFLLAFARGRWPGLVSIHEDLVGDSMRDLVASYRFDASLGTSELDQARAQGATILKRRVIDHFRKPVAEFAHLDVAESLPDPRGLGETAILHRRALRLTLSYLDECSDEQRALLLDDIPGALSSTQRKQRQRLRHDLRTRLDTELGADAASLFEEGAGD